MKGTFKESERKQFCGECGKLEPEIKIAGQCLKCGCGYCENCKHHQEEC